MHEVEFDGHGSVVRWAEIPGRSPARVFVHGLGSSGTWVYGDVALDPRLGGHRSLVVDLPGYGHSDRPVDWSYSLEDHAGVIAAICAARGLAGIDLVGHSLGGDISIIVTARNPGLVGRLVISEANLDPLPASPHGDRESQRIVAQGEGAFVAHGYAALQGAAPRWAPTLRLASPTAIFRSARSLLAGTTPTTRELFYAAPMPRTFLHGDRGEPLLDVEGLLASGVRVGTIPNAGHMVMEDAPEAYADALAKALVAVPAA
ncbi:MAG: alpha/beta hydrolase [Chloroflexi bacterium]|nr:alpha/beta hydrolase [Chloroflexota bacterium]